MANALESEFRCVATADEELLCTSGESINARNPCTLARWKVSSGEVGEVNEVASNGKAVIVTASPGARTAVPAASATLPCRTESFCSATHREGCTHSTP
ncbi:hypothetical protein [Streptomyces sp. CA-132043]|uniref:hypothetical protein n=1 Tax=Streptomyces sp. CA-132043 TaxID=3240048 RepID=UPI003D90733F